MLSPRAQRETLALLGTALLVLIFWNVTLWPGRVFTSSDMANLFWPHRVHMMNSVTEGFVPLWSAHAWLGSPFVAPMQAGVFDPTTWVMFLYPSNAVAMLQSFNAQRLVIFLIMAFNTYALARAGLRVGRSGSMLAALTVSCSSFMWGHFDHINQLSAMAWVPLTLLGTLMAARGGGVGVIVLVAASVALQIFAGHPQHFVLCVLAAALLLLITLIATRSPLKRWIQSAFVLGLGGALGLLIASVQLLPTLELIPLCERSVFGDEFAGSYSMRWMHLIRLIMPNAMGIYPNYATDENYGEFGIFFGRLTLGLALAAPCLVLFRSKDQNRATTIAFFTIAILALLFALGPNGPLFTPLTHILTPLKSFRVPPRVLFHFHVATALLAAIAVDHILRSLGGDRRAALRRGGITALLLLIALAELYTVARPEYHNRSVPVEAAETISPFADAVLSEQPLPRIHRLQVDDIDYFQNITAHGLEQRLLRMQSNMANSLGVGDVEGYTEGLLPTARWRDLMGYLHRNLHQYELDAEVLGLLGVQWVITDVSITPISTQTLRPVDEFIDPEPLGDKRYVLFRNPRALPPIIPTATLEALANPEEIDGFLTRGMADDLVVLGDSAPVISEGAQWPTPESLPHFAIGLRGPNAFEVLNRDDFTGRATLIQATYPGWIVADDVSGTRPVEIQNAAWSAWEIAPGTTRFTLAFRPTSHRLGVFLSSIGMLLLSMAAVRLGAGTGPRRECPAPSSADQCDTSPR